MVATLNRIYNLNLLIKKKKTVETKQKALHNNHNMDSFCSFKIFIN